VFFSALNHFFLATLESTLEASFFFVTLFPLAVAAFLLVNTMIAEIAIVIHSHHIIYLLYKNFKGDAL